MEAVTHFFKPEMRLLYISTSALGHHFPVCFSKFNSNCRTIRYESKLYSYVFLQGTCSFLSFLYFIFFLRSRFELGKVCNKAVL